MFSVNEIDCSFGARRVLKGVSFELSPGKVVGLIGPSGGGKSVLLKIIGGIIKPDCGGVHHTGQTATDLSLMFQEGALFDSLSVFDNVAFPLVGGRVPAVTLPRALREVVQEKVFAILGRVGLIKAAAKLPGQLSGGMRRRVALARALVGRPDLVLLDDPTAGLDPVASSVIMELIIELHREYRPTVIMVSHDLRRLLPLVDTILALFNGRIEFGGTLKQLANLEDNEIKTFVSCRYDLNQVH